MSRIIVFSLLGVMCGLSACTQEQVDIAPFEPTASVRYDAVSPGDQYYTSTFELLLSDKKAVLALLMQRTVTRNAGSAKAGGSLLITDQSGDESGVRFLVSCTPTCEQGMVRYCVDGKKSTKWYECCRYHQLKTALQVAQVNAEMANPERAKAVQIIEKLGRKLTKNNEPSSELVAFRLELQNTSLSDADLKQISHIKSVDSIDLSGTLVTDAGMKDLSTMRYIVSLKLRDTAITGAGLAKLVELDRLRKLDLHNTRISDVGLKRLRYGFGYQFTELDLSGTGMTDIGLVELFNLRSLSKLDLTGTKVTDNGVRRLKKALGERCEIIVRK